MNTIKLSLFCLVLVSTKLLFSGPGPVSRVAIGHSYSIYSLYHVLEYKNIKASQRWIGRHGAKNVLKPPANYKQDESLHLNLRLAF